MRRTLISDIIAILSSFTPPTIVKSFSNVFAQCHLIYGLPLITANTNLLTNISTIALHMHALIIFEMN